MPHGVFHGMSKLLELTIAGEYLIYPSFHFVNCMNENNTVRIYDFFKTQN